MKKRHLNKLSFILVLAPLASCSSPLVIDDLSVKVEQRIKIPTSGEYSFTYEGKDIWIEEGHVRGMLSGTETMVTAMNKKRQKTTFKVKVLEDNYANVENKSSAETTEGWLNEIDISPIPSLATHTDFPMGMDISMTKQIYDQGGQFYNEEGRAESVYRILKRAGVNYVRFRLWNDPYNHFINEDSEEVSIPYGGGINDLPTVVYMAQSAKEAGLKVLLDFHFSDFWADPGKQVLPKEFAHLTTSDEVAEALYNYVKNSLNAFQNLNALPDMVQLGNEITPGIFTSMPGPVNEKLTGDSPYYTSRSTPINQEIAGYSGTPNLIKYLNKAIQAVNEVNPDILKMLHLARGFSNSNNLINFFTQFKELDYEIIGLSAYSYYHFQTGFDTLRTSLIALSEAFPDKKINLVETAYGFTYAAFRNASNIFSRSGNISAFPGYDVSVQGQANFMVDLIKSIADLPNGYGFFYWEGAWIPVFGAGWADSRSKDSWANQTFFTYSGKVLPSLGVYKHVFPT